MQKRPSSSSSLLIRVIIILVTVFLTVAIFSGPYPIPSPVSTGSLGISRNVFAKMLPTIVSVRSSGNFLGSGVLVGRDVVLTSAHILPNQGDVLFVTQDTRQVLVSSVVKHSQKDLALLFLAEDVSGSVASIISSQALLAPGDNVFGFGKVDDMILGHEGVLSSVAARVSLGGQLYVDLLLSDIPLQAGYSGGPLVNTSGEIIGIHTMFQAGVSGGWSTPVDARTLAVMLSQRAEK